MTCRDLDDLFDRSLAPAEWPSEARGHLETCARCRAMEEALTRISTGSAGLAGSRAAMPSMLNDLVPVRRLPPLPLEALLLALSTAGIGALLAAATGNQGWFALAAGQRASIFPTVLAAVAGQSVLVALEMEPGRSRGRMLRILHWLAPGAFFATAFVLFRYEPQSGFLHHSALCFSRGLLTAVAVLAGVQWLVRRGYFVSFRRVGAALGLLAGLGGFLSQELYCPILETAHVTVAHIGLLAVSSLTGFLLGVLAARRWRS